MINATKQVSQAMFFVAPYLASPQLNYFLQAKMVHSMIGSAKLLSYSSDMCAQVIVDFDLVKKNFTYIEREELLKNGATAKTIVDLYALTYGQSMINNDNLAASWDKLVASKDATSLINSAQA